VAPPKRFRLIYFLLKKRLLRETFGKEARTEVRKEPCQRPLVAIVNHDGTMHEVWVYSLSLQKLPQQDRKHCGPVRLSLSVSHLIVFFSHNKSVSSSAAVETIGRTCRVNKESKRTVRFTIKSYAGHYCRSTSHYV
jgi:hypothetical protein